MAKDWITQFSFDNDDLPIDQYRQKFKNEFNRRGNEARRENDLNFYGASGQWPNQKRNFNQSNNQKMYNNNQAQGRQQNVRTNQVTGEAEVIKTAYEIVNKKSGELISGHFKTYFEVGSTLYKIEISPRLKETKNGGNAMWVKITKKSNQRRQQARF